MSNVTITSEERQCLRELARRKVEIGHLPVQHETARLWNDLNGLRPTRPLVWINELPWHELAAKAPAALTPRCQDRFLAGVEWGLRAEQYQWEHFAGDMVVEPVLYSGIVGGPTSSYADYGIQEKHITQEGGQDVIFDPVITTMEDVAKIQTPKVWYDKEETQRRLTLLQEVFDGVMPVRPRGIVTQWHTPWDQAVHWTGVTELLIAMYDKPEVIAGVCERVCTATMAVLDRQQELGMLDVGDGNWRVGSGGLGYTDELPRQVSGRPVTPRDQWGCGNAQIFSEVSPDMHEEFSLRFERPVMERFGLTYYGCCEPLHTKLGLLSRIRNLRKISMSPKADLRMAAEAAHRKYVLSFKPNPAHLAPDTFRPELVREYLRDSLKQLQGSPSEVILKDVTTIRSDPARLEAWAQVAMSVAREFPPA